MIRHMDTKVIVITGASSGIGAALALKLATEGYRLVLAARRGPELRRIAEEAEAQGSPGAVVVEADMTRREDVNRLRDMALKRFGYFDVWVNNAGRGITRHVMELTDEDVDTIMTVNLKSALYGMQAAVPHFIEQGAGQIINVSSMLGRIPFATRRSIYSAAKSALNALTANLRIDLQSHPGIHVTLVMPGLVSTDFAKNVLGDAPAAAVPTWRPPPSANGPQTPETVAEVISRVIQQPVPEVYTNGEDAAEMVRRYYADVATFEADMAQQGR
jgi:NAD(P)-dependent dehydrogenase (short-subunit alcohol dehydrogenase family)